MNKSENSGVGILNFITILLLLTLAFNSFWAIVSAYVTKIHFSNNIALIILLLIVTVNLVLYHLKKQLFLDTKRLILSLLFLISISVLFIINFLINGIGTLGGDINTYGWILPCIILINSKYSISERKVEECILIAIIPQLLLGIMQHFLRKLFVPIIFNGKTIVNTIFFLNGASSNDPNYLNYGAQIRAFGMTDSGLTLGILSLLVFTISLYTNKFSYKTRLLLFIISSISIYTTLTRNIYVACLVLVLLKFLISFGKVTRHVLNMIFVFVMFFSFAGVYISSLLVLVNNYVSGLGITTFAVRFQYLHNVLQRLSGLRSVLFGLQIKPNINNPIDNSVVAIIVDKGSLIALLLILFFAFCYVYVVNKKEVTQGLKNKDLTFAMFFLTFPIISFANNVTTTYGYLLIIALLLLNGKKDGKNVRRI